MFGDKGRLPKQTTLRAIMNTKMTKGTLIRNHMVCMIKLFNEMKILGAKIDGENIILETYQISSSSLSSTMV